MNKDKILSLISLLDDENENTASFALKELINGGKKTMEVLSEFQESPQPLIRKRVHQIQAIHQIKKARDILSRRLENKHSGLWNGLMEIHLAWFDRDTKENINLIFCELLEEFLILDELSAESVASFMKMTGFVLGLKGNIDPEYYCLGSVLESKIGNDSLLSAIAYKLLIERGIKAKLIRYQNTICLLMDNKIIIPDDWITLSQEQPSFDILTPGQVLKYTILQLLLSTVSTDNYRYTYTIGKCLKRKSSFLNTSANKNEEDIQ